MTDTYGSILDKLDRAASANESTQVTFREAAAAIRALVGERDALSLSLKTAATSVTLVHNPHLHEVLQSYGTYLTPKLAVVRLAAETRLRPGCEDCGDPLEGGPYCGCCKLDLQLQQAVNRMADVIDAAIVNNPIMLTYTLVVLERELIGMIPEVGS